MNFRKTVIACVVFLAVFATAADSGKPVTAIIPLVA